MPLHLTYVEGLLRRFNESKCPYKTLHLTCVEGLLLHFIKTSKNNFSICLHLTYERNYYEYLSPQ